MKEPNWKAAYFSMRSKMLAERKARLAWEMVAAQRRSDHAAACNRHVEAAVKLKAAKQALNEADNALTNCHATIISYDSVMRNQNQSVAYQLGMNHSMLIHTVAAVRETISKAVQ